MADENKQDAPQKVDETPISPTKDRRNSLEKHLQQRPQREELVEKNILPASTAAAGIQAQQKEVGDSPFPPLTSLLSPENAGQASSRF